MDLRGNPGLLLPTLFAKKFSCRLSYRLVEVDDRGPNTSVTRGAYLPPMVIWKAPITVDHSAESMLWESLSKGIQYSCIVSVL